MKKISLSIIAIFCIFSILATGCGNTSTATLPPAVETAALTEAATEGIPESTLTLSPTPEPEPIACTIAFETARDGNWEVYRMNPDGSDPVNLSNNPGDDVHPAWSPDGSQVAFASNRENEAGSANAIYIMNADGTNVRQFTQEYYSDWPDWSHDGSAITFDSGEDIVVTKAEEGAELIYLTHSPEKDIQPSWSPDGSKIAWLSGDDGNWNVFVMNPDGSNVVQITDNGEISSVRWTIDGRLLTGWGWKDKEQICNNCVVNVDGSEIIDAGGKGSIRDYIPFWTVDGEKVEIADTDVITGDSEIFLVGEIFPDLFFNLTNNPAADQFPAWPANCGPITDETVTLEETEAPKPDELIFGYLGADGNTALQREEELVKACNELEIQCVKGESISALAEQNVNAIIAFSNRFHVLGANSEIHDAVSKGILLIMLNAETDVQGAYNLSVESDSTLSTLKWIFTEMGGTGDFAYYNFGQNDFIQSLIDQLLKEYPGIKATSKPADFSVQLTEEDIKTLVNSNPNLGGIWTDQFLNNVFWGVNNTQAEHLPAIPCASRKDILQAWSERKEADPSFKCYSTIKPGGTGYEGVYVAYYILTGEEINPAALGGLQGNTFLYDYPVITNDNLDEYLAKIDSFRNVDGDTLEVPPMTPEEIKAKWFLE
jgi:TolB protein